MEITSEAECFGRIMTLVEYRPGIWTSELRRAIPECSNEVFNEAVARIKRSPLIKARREGNKTVYYRVSD